MRILAHAIWLSGVGSQPLLFMLQVAGVIADGMWCAFGEDTQIRGAPFARLVAAVTFAWTPTIWWNTGLWTANTFGFADPF